MRDMIRELKILSKGIITKTVIPPLLKHIRMDGEDAFISAIFPFNCLPRMRKGAAHGSVGRGGKKNVISNQIKDLKSK